MSDVKNHSTLPTNLVSYWSLEEASSTRYDAHASNDLAENGTGGVGQGTGKVDNCADFVRSDSDYLSISDASQSGLDITGDISFSFWIKPDSVVGDHFIISKGDWNTGTRDIAYSVWTDGYLRFRYSDDGTLNSGHNISYYSSSGAISAGSWQHVVITWTASTKTCLMYVNGSKQTAAGAGTGGTSINNSSDQFDMGRRLFSTPSHWDGLLDEVGIWSKILSDSEVSDLYNSGDGIPYDAGGGGGGATDNALTWCNF